MTRTCTPTSRSPTRCRPWTGGGWPWTPGCCTGSPSPASEFYNTAAGGRGHRPGSAGRSPNGPPTDGETPGPGNRRRRPATSTSAWSSRRRGDRHRPPRSCGPVPRRPRPGPDHGGIDLAGAAGQPGHPGAANTNPGRSNEQRAAWHDQAVEVLGGNRTPRPTMVAAASHPHAATDAGRTGHCSSDLTAGTIRTLAAAPGAVAGNQRAGRGDPAGPGRRCRRPGQVNDVAAAGHHPGASPAEYCVAGRGGHRDSPARTRPRSGRAAPHGWDVGVPGREGPAVHLTRGAGRRAADRRRRRPDRRATRRRRRMWSWRCWNGPPTAAAGS